MIILEFLPYLLNMVYHILLDFLTNKNIRITRSGNSFLFQILTVY